MTGRRFVPESFPNFGRGFVDRSERREATDRNDIIYTELENWDIHDKRPSSRWMAIPQAGAKWGYLDE